MSVVTYSDDTVLAVSDQLLSTQLGSEAVILNLRSGVYFGLDPVGARVWDLIQKPITVAHLRATLLDEFEVDAARLNSDLTDLLGNMQAEGLVRVTTPAGAAGAA
jgi:hypothetical protein